MAGFRPFFLGAAISGIALISYWVLFFNGWLSPSPVSNPISWHAHEMLFGFSMAVIAGFLLTASAHWTNTAPVSGTPLIVLFSLWILGRIGMAFSLYGGPAWFAYLDLAFLPAFITVLFGVLRKGKPRNLAFCGWLGVALVGNALFHAAWLPLFSHYAESLVYAAIRTSLGAVLIILLIAGGRIIPSFTRNAFPNLVTPAPRIAWAVLICASAYALFSTIPYFDLFSSFTALLAGTTMFINAYHWRGWKTLRYPIITILHIGYASIAAGFLIRGLQLFAGPSPSSTYHHAFAVGGIALLSLGMMGRVTLGHTGRGITATTTTKLSYVALCAAAFIRVLLPVLEPTWYLACLLAAGTLWTLAFGLYLVEYAPKLCAARIDGRRG